MRLFVGCWILIHEKRAAVEVIKWSEKGAVGLLGKECSVLCIGGGGVSVVKEAG